MVSSLSNYNTSGSLTVSFNCERRLEELRQKMKVFETGLGITKRIDLAIGHFQSSPCARLDKKIMEVPSWFLFHYDDIPPQFRIASIDDRRITDPVFLNQFAVWMNTKIHAAGLTSICRPMDMGTLQLVIKLFRDHNLHEQSRDFIIGHEMAHFAHSFDEEKTMFMQNVQEGLCIGGITSGLILLFLTVALFPLLNVALTLTVAGIGIAVSSISVVALFKIASGTSPNLIEEEKTADLDSVKILQEARGGIYYFETSRQHNLAIRRSNPSRAANIDELGNNISDVKHPRLSERVVYLRAWHSENFQRA